MKYASVCSGVEAASLAWMPLGWQAAWFSEIEPFPCAVLKERFPDVPNLGDMTKIKVETMENGDQKFTGDGGTVVVPGGVDLLVGGTPCFAASAMVLTPEGYKPIESLRVGNKVVSHLGNICEITVWQLRRKSANIRPKSRMDTSGCLPDRYDVPIFSRERIQWRWEMIYAIDFDGTIVKNAYPEIGELNPVAEKFIKELQMRGDKWILWTLRGGEKLDEAVKFLESHGLKPDAVNDNLLSVQAQFTENPNPRKVFANIYIDDHNAGGLNFNRYLYTEEDTKEFLTSEQVKITDKCDKLKSVLLNKNRKYGNSALEPCRIFSRANAVEQILVRIDDKLNRIKNRQNDEDEDVIMDLAGYLILLMIAREKETDRTDMNGRNGGDER